MPLRTYPRQVVVLNPQCWAHMAPVHRVRPVSLSVMWMCMAALKQGGAGVEG